MECANADTLAGLVAGALPEAERAAIATHAASCKRCHALIDELFESSSAGGPVTPAGPDDTTQGDEPDGSRPSRISLRPGAHVGRYVIEERIGAGGMGVVFAATDSELHRRVAIKLLRQGGQGHARMSTAGRERLMREARLLASLSHPNVLTVFDVGTHETDVFIAMELVDGGSLSSWLRRAPRTTDEIIDRMIEAGRGLGAAHAGGVVHRDVKPDNILVGLDGRARVTDFGLARIDQELAPDIDAMRAAALSPDLTKTGALMGTPVYMAPEQWRKGAVDPRTDQWSFCATLYELVAGVRPFTVDDPDKRAAEIEEGRIAAPADGRTVPSWLRKIVERGLRANPKDRWPSMEVVVAALVRGRGRKSRIVRAVVIAGVLAAAVASVGIVVAKRSSHPATLTDKQRREASYTLMAWEDLRPGCSCPFSVCEKGACLSSCNATDFDYGQRAAIPGVTVDGNQEALAGVSGDEQTLLYLSGRRCALDRVMVARRGGAAYVSTDITDRLDPKRVKVYEGCCTLASDGRSMLISTPDRRGLVRVPLDAMAKLDGSEFADLLPDKAEGMTLGFPVLSHDELTIYFTVYDRVASPTEEGPLDGVYSSTRASTSAPFPPGTRMPGVARQYAYVTGESADGLTLFMASEFMTRVLTRRTRDGKYGAPFEATIPARVAGWRAVPSRDCSRLYTTETPGGCAAENIVVIPAIHKPPVVPYDPNAK
ncbi:MAG TPA: protein kinase [Kofleriaceae bacterium]|nr:protein kinase [Kofleriaceae bacterium]